MFEYLNLLFNSLFYVISFSGYVWKRLFCVIEEYLRPLCGLSKLDSDHMSDAERPWYYMNILNSKTFLYETGILLPVRAELKLAYGRVYVKKRSSSRLTLAQNREVKIKTSSSIDEINIFYKGSMRCMSYVFPFCVNVTLENMKIFTEFSLFTSGCKSIVDDLHIGNIKFRSNKFNCTLRNTSTYFLISGILRPISFLYLCLWEFIIMINLKLKFSSTDVNIFAHEYTLSNSLINYMKKTKNTSVGSSTAKSIISVINDELVLSKRKFLFHYFYEFLHSSNIVFEDLCQEFGGDARQVQVEDVRLMWEVGPSGETRPVLPSGNDHPVLPSGNDHTVLFGNVRPGLFGDDRPGYSGDNHPGSSEDDRPGHSGDNHPGPSEDDRPGSFRDARTGFSSIGMV